MPSSGIDRTLAFLILCLIILGSLFVYSSTYYQAMKNGASSAYYLIGHLKRLVIAIGFFFLGLFLPIEKMKKLMFPALILLLFMLFLTLIAGRVQFGARRSLLIASFGLQISEFARIWAVFFLANFFANHPQVANSGRGLVTTVMIVMVVILLVAFQPSISVATITFLTMVSMLIYGGARFRLFAPTLLVGAGLFGIFILVFPHAQQRMTSFLSHPAYQVQQSLIAIGSGGVWGRGLGAGLQKFLFLPRIYNDFIFAHIAEEFGFIGSMIIFVLYGEVFLRGLAIARFVESEFLGLLVFGLNASIFIIFLVHVGVSIGLLPATGIPMPFISYGGWSLSANLFAMGIILQASRWRVL
jgi:cell division protein FtsW